MATSTVVPLGEYLRTSYRPDCDWIDGEVRERNVGEGSHASIQKFFIRYFGNRETEWGVLVWPEQRVQVSARRFRIPDVCLTAESVAFEEIIRVPPVLCIEILSRDDRMSDILERVEDYFKMGVGAAWVVDPWQRQAFSVDADGTMREEAEALVVEGTAIRVPVGEIFKELDRLQRRAE